MAWPRDNQEDLIKFYGNPAGGVAPQLVKVIPPFRMTYDGKPLSHLMFHRLAAPALERALKRVWDYYGHDQKKIDALGISKTAGTYNPRFIRGSTTKWSNHAYGAAIDINAEENGFNVAGNIPIPMIAAFKAEGARWGGDYKGRTDPMHFEFCASGEPARTFDEWLKHYGAKPLGAPRAVKPPKGITADMRRRMAKSIVDFEARRDARGRLAVYNLPANDGGGAYEVAGINVKYHPAQAAKLKALIAAGKHDEAEQSVIDYLVAYTNVASGWTPYAGVEFYLRDSVFNRGPKGAARILQRALGVPDDGEIGPTTRDVMAALTADEILTKLRAGREDYERNVVGYRANFWRGLVNRWDKALASAQAFQKEQGALPAIVKRTIETGTGGGLAAYTFWDWIKDHPLETALIILALGALAFVAFRILKKSRAKPPAQPIAPIPAIIESEGPPQ